MSSEWVGTAQSQNTKDRMEDEVVIRCWKDGGLFAVLDGHNGRSAVEFVASHLPENILHAISFTQGNFQEALSEGISQTERELLAKLKQEARDEWVANKSDVEEDLDFPLLTSGVVVCVCLVLVKQGTVFTANVGDCRAVLSRKTIAQQVTCDHNIQDAAEKKRVQPFISHEGFVKGLMVTRSLGNVKIRSLEKCEGQIAEPSLSHFPIGDSDDFLLIASDGLYEVVSNEVAVSTVQRAMKRPSFSPGKAAKELVDRAVARGSCDNICVCLIMLKRPRYS